MASRHHHHHHHHHQRSLSPSSGRFCASSISHSSSFSTSSSSFSSKSSSNNTNSLFHRSSSPTRINMCGSPQTMRFAIDNRRNSSSSTSPSRSISVNRSSVSNHHNGLFSGAAVAGKKKITCMCSPTNHPGSFRCNFHKNLEMKKQNQNQTAAAYQPHRLNMRRSAMTNSLVRIGTVEGGEWVKRALATLIRPSSHQQRRRHDFCPRPSRLSVMSKASDEDNR